jgi:hypothetical protein
LDRLGLEEEVDKPGPGDLDLAEGLAIYMGE